MINKKAREEWGNLISLIMVILVVVIFLFMIIYWFFPDVFKNLLPSWIYPNQTIEDDNEFCTPFGEIKSDNYIYINDVKTRLFVEENFIYFKSGWFNKEKIGEIANSGDKREIIIYQNYLDENCMEKFDLSVDKCYSEKEILLLDKGYRVGKGRWICKDEVVIKECDESKGEIFLIELGECMCNSVLGYYGIKSEFSSSLKPWASFNPPCFKSDVLDSYAFDSSVDRLEINEDEMKDKGLCVAYYSNKMLIEALVNKDLLFNDEDAKELLKYDMSDEGYINRVYKIFELKEIARYSCIGHAEDYEMFYTIFYDEPAGNLLGGYGDDEGYCVKYNNGNIEVLETLTRQDCYDVSVLDLSSNYDYFVAEKGKNELEIKNEEMVS